MLGDACFFSKVYADAVGQLEKGREWLEHVMRMLNMDPWTYVGFVAFPNIDNREALKEAGLVKHEKELKVSYRIETILPQLTNHPNL